MKDKILEAYEGMLNENMLNEGTAKDLQWLNRHVDGFNVRLTALFGLDAAYTDNRNFKKIKQIMRQLKGVTDELKKAILDEMQDEKMRERSR
jgi:hypothetical protein